MVTTEEQSDDWLRRAIETSFNQIKKIFDGKSKTEAVLRIVRLGFDQFSQNMEVFYIKNLQLSRYPAFIENLLSQRTIK